MGEYSREERILRDKKRNENERFAYRVYMESEWWSLPRFHGSFYRHRSRDGKGVKGGAE